jgi:hypothetical protein
MNFKDFKKNQNKMNDAIKGMTPSTPSYVDEREWKITKGKDGTGTAILRFLPQKDSENAPPVVQTFKHYFNANGRWFIEKCPVTIEQECPVCDYAKDAWDDDDQDSKKYWRKKEYTANVLVVEDKGNKENEGKVFIFKFGQQIFDLIMELVAPEDEDEEAKNIFDFDSGFNFKMRLTQKGGYNNYEKSKFLLEEVAIDEDKQEAVFNAIHDLSEFKNPNQFKSLDEITKKFNNIMNMTVTAPKSVEEDIKSESTEVSAPSETKDSAPAETAPETEDELGLEDIEGIDDELDDLFED